MALSLVMLAALTACGGGKFKKSDDEAIRKLLGAQQQAWNRGDLDGYMAAYQRSPELVFSANGVIRRGWDDVFAKYKEKYGEEKGAMGTLVFKIEEVQGLGEGAIVLGRWELTNTPEAGAGTFTLGLRRTGEGWRIFYDHTAGSPEPLVP